MKHRQEKLVILSRSGTSRQYPRLSERHLRENTATITPQFTFPRPRLLLFPTHNLFPVTPTLSPRTSYGVASCFRCDFPASFCLIPISLLVFFALPRSAIGIYCCRHSITRHFSIICSSNLSSELSGQNNEHILTNKSFGIKDRKS